MRGSVLAAAVLVTAAVTVTACHKPADPAATKLAPAVKVTTVTATLAPAPEVLTLTGTIAADERSEVTAEIQGKVVNVMIARGDHVKLGQKVVQLDVRTAALSAREAQANLAAARAQRQLADQECARTKQLLAKGAITQSEYDRQMTQCQAALESVAAAQARSEMMAKSVADGFVRAPFPGVIDQKMVSPGEWVAPGKPLFTLVKDDPLKILLSVPENAVASVHEGERVTLDAVAYPGKTYGATITRLGAEIGRSRSLIVEAQLDKGSQLVPGMFAEAHLVIGTKPHVVLPEAAVVHRDQTWQAFVVDNGELEERIVQLGWPPGPGKVTVLLGIDKGDKVVAKVAPNIVDGLRVTE